MELPGLNVGADTACPTGAEIGDQPTISDADCAPISTVVGYMGGAGCCPTYDNHSNPNNFSETVRLSFDESLTSYEDLLDAYWLFLSLGSPSGKPPTEPCVDFAYCARIFYVDDEQRTAAEASLAVQQKLLPLKTLAVDILRFTICTTSAPARSSPRRATARESTLHGERNPGACERQTETARL